MTDRKPFIIGVAGGSGAFKITITREIMRELGDIHMVVIPHDAYYKANNLLPLHEREKINYDHPDALETNLLVYHLKELCVGRSIEMPVYDFTIHNRKETGLMVKPAPLIIVDGILIFVEKELRDMMDVRVYVDTDDDIRFIRRLQRDIEERKRTMDSVIHQYLNTVKPMHIAFVEPSRRFADIIIPQGHSALTTGMVSDMIRQTLTKRHLLAMEYNI